MKTVITLCLLTTVISGCGAKTENSDATKECADRGVKYFKDVGSYPTLQSTGELASQVALERCKRTTTAF